MPLKAGPPDAADSMSGAIKAAFKTHYKAVMGKDAPEPNQQMDILFVSIAEGVINHLKAQEVSFIVHATYDSHLIDGTLEIKTEP